MNAFEKNLASYDMVAATVVVMIFGHAVLFFEAGPEWLEILQFVLWPVFILPVGYNLSRKFDFTLLYWGLGLAAIRYGFLHDYFPGMQFWPLGILISISCARLALPQLMEFMLTGRAAFWGAVMTIVGAGYYAHAYVSDYWPLVMMLSIAGWLLRARAEVPERIVDVRAFFVMCFLYYIAFIQYVKPFPWGQMAPAALACAYVFYLLYNYKARLLVAVRRRPKDMIEKACSYIGHKSLEIYAIHLGAIYILYWWAIAF